MHVSHAFMRPVVNRNIAIRGPKFYRDGERVLFVNHIDSATREGPRDATETDAEAFPAAYATFLDEEGGKVVSPLKPAVTFVGAPPPREKGPNEKRRDEAAERGDAA